MKYSEISKNGINKIKRKKNRKLTLILVSLILIEITIILPILADYIR